MGTEVAFPVCSGGLDLAVDFSVPVKQTVLLISLLGTSGVAPSTRLMKALNLQGTCS